MKTHLPSHLPSPFFEFLPCKIVLFTYLTADWTDKYRKVTIRARTRTRTHAHTKGTFPNICPSVHLSKNSPRLASLRQKSNAIPAATSAPILGASEPALGKDAPERYHR